MNQESLIQAQQFLDAGDNESAQEAFAQILVVNPEDVEALIGVGKARSCLGQFKAALDAFEKALEYDPNSAEAHHNIAWILHYQMRAWDEAHSHIEQAIALAPDIAKYHLLAWESARRRHDTSTALRHFQTAYRLDPAAFDGRMRRYLTYLELSVFADKCFVPILISALLLAPTYACCLLENGQGWGITLGAIPFGLGSATYALNKRYRLAFVFLGVGVFWVVSSFLFLRTVGR